MRDEIANAQNKGIGVDGNRRGEDSDDEEPSPNQSFSNTSPTTARTSGIDGDDGDDDVDGDDKLQSLPDSHVPLGLLANLALSNNSKVRAAKKEGREKEEILAEEVNLDDDNVVRAYMS